MSQIESPGTPDTSPIGRTSMLISREELRYDWGGAQFDFSREADRKLLGWVFNQFLYGEVTGIQCGHWLYRAPSLHAASFLAKQAGEELSHVRKILRILSLLGEKPAPAHRAVRFLSTGMMGGSWGEHVAMEMALGEGLVLTVFYALVDTCHGNREIHKILDSAAGEEERHVEFGERETLAWLKQYPKSRNHLLGLALVQAWALQRLRGFVTRRVIRQVGADHAVLKQFGSFFEHAIRKFEVRIEKLGLSDCPLREIPAWRQAYLMITLPFRSLVGKFSGRQPLLTETYLSDPALEAELRRYSHPS